MLPIATQTIMQPKTIIDKLLPAEVRTRFAPSPTGFLHIGSLRTTLYAYLVAKHYKGKFLLRIEDTDQTRFVKGAITDLFNALKWTGMEPDEYSMYNDSEEYIKDIGAFGPYIQSRRLDIYKKYAQSLIDSGKAYYCFCSAERLTKMREAQIEKKMITRYDRACRELSPDEVREKLKANMPHVIRFKTPEAGETILEDLVRGEIKVKNHLIDDYILLKTDGYPTYHLASVIDDHLMEITHIIRGEEWLATAPLHKLLYEAFGWEAPLFAHLPSILGEDKKKLSKRTGDVAVNQYIEKGYLPDALLNFILLLGWNPGTEKEIFSREEMIAEFSLDRVGKSGAIFDLKKLDSVNGQYIRKMELGKLTEMCVPYLVNTELINKIRNTNIEIRNKSEIQNSNDLNKKYIIKKTSEEIGFEWLKKVIALEQERMKKLSDIAESTAYIFVDIPEYSIELLKWKKSTLEKAKENLAEILKILENFPEEKFNKADLEIALKPLMEKLGVGDTLWPLRVALSGAKFSPNPFEIAEVLGKEKVLKRINTSIEKIR